jgi:hypothetical protein
LKNSHPRLPGAQFDAFSVERVAGNLSLSAGSSPKMRIFDFRKIRIFSGRSARHSGSGAAGAAAAQDMNAKFHPFTIKPPPRGGTDFCFGMNSSG